MPYHFRNHKKIIVSMIWLVISSWLGFFYSNFTVYGDTAENGTTENIATPTPLSELTPVPTTLPFETEYAVGIIDVTWSNVESTDLSDPYPATLNIDGRTAFYLKGKIRGKYLLTAQMDTGEKTLAEVFQNLHRKDPGDIFKKIDPARYYPVYGDQSTIIHDVASRGKLYVRLEWDKSKVLLGDYHVHMEQTDLVQYNRSLYGLNVNLANPTGEKTPVDTTQLFLAEPSSLHSSDTMRATGGMLYYLKHADIVLGSEQIKVELRSSISGAVLSTIPLEYGRDYDLDYAQGRIILKRDLAAVIAAHQITASIPNEGNIPFVIADYEFEGEELTYRPNYGLQASGYFSQNLKWGSRYIQESTDQGANYRLYSLNTSLQLNQNMEVSAEWAKSDQSLSHRYYSEDGGLTYATIVTNHTTEGSSWKIGFDFHFPKNDVVDPFKISAYTLFQEAGFSTAAGDTLHDMHQNSLEITGKIFGNQFMRWLYHSNTEKTIKDSLDTAFQLIQENGKLKYTEEIRFQTCHDLVNLHEYQITLGGFRLDYQMNDRVAVYGTEQLTLAHNNITPSNNRTTLGVQIQLNPKTNLNFEGSTGDLGNNINAGYQYQPNPEQTVYLKSSFETDPNQGETLISTAGSRSKISENVNAVVERRIGSGSYEKSLSNLLGIDYSLRKGWLLSAAYTQSEIEKLAERPTGLYPFPDATSPGGAATTGTGSVNRRIFNLGSVCQQNAFQLKNGLEIRWDDGDIDSTQYLLTNTYQNIIHHDYTYYCKLNYSITQDTTAATELARFIESTVGIAYRPVQDDRFNFLGEFTYIDQRSPAGQISGTVPREISQIISLEGIYDLDTRWQLAEKVAYKHSAIELDPDNWGTNDLYLWINRINYHLLFQWDLSAEYRILKDIQADDQKSGFLVAAYYQINPHNRLGIGYNFTDFNDNLAYLNYHSAGFFVNYTYQW